MFLGQKFLSPVELMFEIGESYSTVLRGIKKGRIPSVKLGGRLLIPSSFVEALENSAYMSLQGAANVLP